MKRLFRWLGLMPAKFRTYEAAVNGLVLLNGEPLVRIVAFKHEEAPDLDALAEHIAAVLQHQAHSADP
jgi:hypothetical protein